MSISDPLPNGTFVRHKKTGKTGTIINNRQNPYYCTPEYRIKLTNKSGRYMQSMWACAFCGAYNGAGNHTAGAETTGTGT